MGLDNDDVINSNPARQRQKSIFIDKIEFYGLDLLLVYTWLRICIKIEKLDEMV